MHRHLILFSAALLSTASSVAAGPFDGTWKGDIAASQVSEKPTIYLLNNGNYSCPTCTPKVDVPADGAYHPVIGSPYYDKLAVTVVNATTVKRASTLRGKPATESTTTVSADGKTLATSYNDMTATNGVAVTSTGSFNRVAATPSGAHAMSGSWQRNNAGESSDSGLMFTMAVDKDMVSYSTPTGVTYQAKLGGTQAPVTGDPGWTSLTVRSEGPNVLHETDFRDGKAVASLKMTVSSDGKTMTVNSDDLEAGRKSTFIARKQ